MTPFTRDPDDREPHLERDPYAPAAAYEPHPLDAPTGPIPRTDVSGARFVPPPDVGAPRAATAPDGVDDETFAPRSARWRQTDRWLSDKAGLRETGALFGLVGGVLILLGAFVVAMLLMAMGLFGGPTWAWWTFGYQPDPDGVDGFPSMALAIVVWGLVSGALVLLGAARARDRDATALPGVAMVVGGLLSFLAFGGFLLGGLAAILGGVLAIAGAEAVLPARTRGRAA